MDIDDEHETTKAFHFLNTTLTEVQASNLIYLNEFLIKLEKY